MTEATRIKINESAVLMSSVVAAIEEAQKAGLVAADIAGVLELILEHLRNDEE